MDENPKQEPPKAQNGSYKIISAKELLSKIAAEGSSASSIKFDTRSHSAGSTKSPLTIPEPEVILPKKDRIFTVRFDDWTRIIGRVETMSDKSKDWGSAGWALIGIFFSTLLAAIAWAPVSNSFSDEDAVAFAWVMPTLVAIVIASAVTSVVIFVAAFAIKGVSTATAEEVKSEMKRLLPEET